MIMNRDSLQVRKSKHDNCRSIPPPKDPVDPLENEYPLTVCNFYANKVRFAVSPFCGSVTTRQFLPLL